MSFPRLGGKTPSSSSMKSFPGSCATNWFPTICAISGLKKGLNHLDAVRKRFQIITDRFAELQGPVAPTSHVDFPLLQRLALPVTIDTVRYPGIKIHEARIIRLMEVLLHGGTAVGGWTAKQIHQTVLTTFELSRQSLRPESTPATTCGS